MAEYNMMCPTMYIEFIIQPALLKLDSLNLGEMPKSVTIMVEP